MTNGQKFRKFLKDHPAVQLKVFAEEVEVQRATLRYLLKEGTEPRESTWQKIKPLMFYYGYKE